MGSKSSSKNSTSNTYRDERQVNDAGGGQIISGSARVGDGHVASGKGAKVSTSEAWSWTGGATTINASGGASVVLDLGAAQRREADAIAAGAAPVSSGAAAGVKAQEAAIAAPGAALGGVNGMALAAVGAAAVVAIAMRKG